MRAGSYGSDYLRNEMVTKVLKWSWNGGVLVQFEVEEVSVAFLGKKGNCRRNGTATNETSSYSVFNEVNNCDTDYLDSRFDIEVMVNIG